MSVIAMGQCGGAGMEVKARIYDQNHVHSVCVPKDLLQLSLLAAWIMLFRSSCAPGLYHGVCAVQAGFSGAK